MRRVLNSQSAKNSRNLSVLVKLSYNISVLLLRTPLYLPSTLKVKLVKYRIIMLFTKQSVYITPADFFNGLFSSIDNISAYYGVHMIVRGYKPNYYTCCVFVVLFLGLPLIIYTMVAYDVNMSLRSVTLFGAGVQVNYKIKLFIHRKIGLYKMILY